MKRTAFNRKTPLRKRSFKRSSVEAKDAKLKREMFKRYEVACIFGNGWLHCATIDMAHIFGKKTYPHLRHNILNVLPLCRFCHEYCHDHPQLGQEEMLAKLSSTDRTKLERLAAQRR